ncbi:stage III sporulation protein AE [Desulfosporosinus sp. BICA1-9]|uniref:stage III sporulation protein AE n=1 Tax=Desulfosporosinus sp. BICA1-9 TaxID=1531958 RepID=UPI00054BBF0C|nr:stage III sporulation protein AE [Desulfosporosinus sp. BICA1-9]KJS49809.1 MAG: stage III sporulation protein AE [Peptococcaceae bacterium BRH_c23]KJS78800.1 MAG: stage III sporulation protein AE [Desulfosporosinus sp. BICA1-9]HBW36211.1 stage III sporulation protein AE [Desulfosporosinus sp.]
MRRFFLSLVLLIILLSGTTSPVYAEEAASPSAGKVELSQKVDLSQMRGFLDQLDGDVQKAMPGFSLVRMFEDLKSGKLSLRPENIGQTLLTLLGHQVLGTAPLIGKLLILAVLGAVLGQLQVAFGGSVGKTAQVMTYLVLLSLAITSFREALTVATGAIDQMVGLMQTIFPVILTLLITMGNLTSAALFKPLIMGSLTVLATLIKTTILPLFFLAAVLKLLNNISEQFKLSKLAGLFEFAGKLCLGVIMTVFIGVMTVQGVTGGVADSVVFRTAKYSADLIPVVGKFFKDAVELVITSGLLLKNAVGIIALIAIIIICLGPLVKILAMIFVFRISAALIEPLGEKALAESLQDMSKSLILVLVTVSSVAIMFFMSVAVVVGTGTFSVMLH